MYAYNPPPTMQQQGERAMEALTLGAQILLGAGIIWLVFVKGLK